MSVIYNRCHNNFKQNCENYYTNRSNRNKKSLKQKRFPPMSRKISLGRWRQWYLVKLPTFVLIFLLFKFPPLCFLFSLSLLHYPVPLMILQFSM